MDERSGPLASTPFTGAQSARLRLARAAREAALGVPGVRDSDGGPGGLFCTVGGGERVDGVSCVAAPDGGYDVSLRLVCELVPLPALGRRVRAAVMAAGARAQLHAASVNVAITGVLGPDET